LKLNDEYLKDKIVIVAGASGNGLGTTTTKMLTIAGATVVAVGRSQEKLDRDLYTLIDQGLKVIKTAADVETDRGIAAVMARVQETPGNLYGLVNVVGNGPMPTWCPCTQVERNNWASLFSSNLDSMFFMSQAVAKELQSSNSPGAIVAVSSITALNTQPYNVGYAAAKSAILSVVRTMGLEIARSNIRVNAVAPGPMSNPASMLPPDAKLMKRAIPMGRKAQVEEVASTILFLLSPAAGYTTGQCITVDGGIGLKGPHLREDNTPILITDDDFLRKMKGE